MKGIQRVASNQMGQVLLSRPGRSWARMPAYKRENKQGWARTPVAAGSLPVVNRSLGLSAPSLSGRGSSLTSPLPEGLRPAKPWALPA